MGIDEEQPWATQSVQVIRHGRVLLASDLGPGGVKDVYFLG